MRAPYVGEKREDREPGLKSRETFSASWKLRALAKGVTKVVYSRNDTVRPLLLQQRCSFAFTCFTIRSAIRVASKHVSRKRNWGIDRPSYT